MDFLKNANAEQLAAITHPEGPLLIIAGAGTGKTKVITSRIAWLILEKKLLPENILALTFTDKTANEMVEKVESLLPLGYVDMWVSTFHSFGDKILRRHALDIGLSPNYQMLDETAAWLLVRKNLDKFNFQYYRQSGRPTKFISQLLKHFSRCKDECITPEAYLAYAEELKLNRDNADFISNLDLNLNTSKMSQAQIQELAAGEAARLEEVANAYHVYQRLLRDNDALDYGDLINTVIELFTKRPLILEAYRQQFQHVLVDEFQDTNLAQYKLIKLLAEPQQNLSVVGDDDQSIYKFRGASITNIMNFKKDYPAAKEVVLTKNYRSVQPILDLAYRFIRQNNPNRLEVQLNINKQLHSMIGQTGEIAHLHGEESVDEINLVLDKLREIKAADKDCTWSDFAILSRSNDVAESFQRALEQAEIPCQFMANQGLYNLPLVVDLLNYAKLLDNYHENSAVFRVLNMSCFDLAVPDIIEIAQYGKSHAMSFFEALKNNALIKNISEATRSRVNLLLTQINTDLVYAKNHKPSKVWLRFINESGYLKKIISLGEKSASEKLRQIEIFFKKILELEKQSSDPRLAEILEIIAWEQEAGDSGKLPFDPEAGPELVKVMTVHSSKGLEFKNVFLVNLVDRRFPTDERHEAIAMPLALVKESLPGGNFHLEEERRLFYVGITRAKERLFLTSADSYGGARAKKLSRFLTELDFSKPEISSKTVINNAVPQTVEAGVLDAYLPVPKRFSVSQMQKYERCPYQYKFSAVYKIPTVPGAQLIFGNVIHLTLQQFVNEYFLGKNITAQTDLFGQAKTRLSVDLSTLLNIYQANWQDSGYESASEKQEYFEKGKRILTSFYHLFTEEKPQVLFLEHSANIKIAAELFQGRIDRIDQTDKGVIIIDYKTGRPKAEKLLSDDKDQLIFYQIVAEEVLELSVAALKYHYLEDETNPYREFKASDKDKSKLKEKYAGILEKIKARQFEAKPETNICRVCEYRGICEYKKI